jgi:hypothetical protein
MVSAFRSGWPVHSVTGMESANFRLERQSRHPLVRGLGFGLAGLVALYLVGRGITEFFIIHYNDPASYARDWGGPSLAGVFAVHSGPAVVIVAVSVSYVIRGRRLRRRG